MAGYLLELEGFFAIGLLRQELQAIEGTRVIKFNTLLRVVYTLGAYLILAHPASAQSVLNFARTTVNGGLNAGFTVTNPTPNHADVQFTLYGLDGEPISSGLVNPVRYRVAPRGQISMLASDIFVASRVDGWVQATSATPGLTGYYLAGDFTSSLEGSAPLAAFTTQVIPVIRDDQTTRTDVIILNPGNGNSNVTVTFFNVRGEEAGTVTRSLAPYGAVRLRPSSVVSTAPGYLSARISSSSPVAAAASIEIGSTLMFAAGQAVDQPASVRVAPHFVSGNGSDSSLVLTNPNASPVVATVTLFNEGVGLQPGPYSRDFVVPPNGSVWADTRNITGVVFPTPANGWLRVDSANVSINTLVVLEQSRSLTAIPLQTAPIDRLTYSAIPRLDSQSTGIVFVNPSLGPAALTVSFIDDQGRLFSRQPFDLPANSKSSTLLRDIFPNAVPPNGGYFTFASPVALYGLEIFGDANGVFMASQTPIRLSNSVMPNPSGSAPTITRISPGTEVRPGASLRVDAANVSDETVFLVGDQVASATRVTWPSAAIFFVDIPPVEPGFANLRMRSGGIESSPILLHVLPSDNLPTQTVSGQAFYQKVDVTDSGLDLSRPVMVPIRSARVEAVDRSLQAVVAVSETDALGRFQLPIPFEPDLTVRILSRLRSSDLRVSDNTNGNTLYTISADIDAREPLGSILLVDNSRVSGAFNILEMVQRGNDIVRLADERNAPPAVNIFWSTRNTTRAGGNIREGLVGTTFFDMNNNTAFVVGDRDLDSDEFDDSVILHEYAHMLAVRFSRDDSPGHSHGVGDILDPRVAWSEGFANFFSSMVRNEAIYRDSRGPNGTRVFRYDLEDNIPPGDKPGYWSEASVHGLLWDLYDNNEDAADDVQFSVSLIWGAFADLKNDRYVYLPYFLDHFLDRNQAAADVLRIMVQHRSIDFQPNVRPSVTNPFPRIVNVGETISGTVDSLSSKRINLMQSAHFIAFTTAGGSVSIRLEIVGLGAGNNPNANDLDLFLTNANGRLLDRSDRGLNGQAELIPVRLPAGAYVIEIRSYYTKAETGGLVFNSGDYRLSVAVQ